MRGEAFYCLFLFEAAAMYILYFGGYL